MNNIRPILTPQDSIDTAHQFHMELHNAERGVASDVDCPHDEYVGDEGPIRDLGRFPVRWRCTNCGHIRIEGERGYRHCVRCDKSQLVVRIDDDGVCRYCKRRVRVSSMLFSRSRHRKAKAMDALAVAFLLTFMAAFGALMFLHAGGPIG